jgi:ATP-dependent Zn protease
MTLFKHPGFTFTETHRPTFTTGTALHLTHKKQLQGGEKFTSYAPNDPHLVDDLLANGVEIKAQAADQESMLMQIFISWFPMLLLIGVWVFFMRQMQGGASPYQKIIR